MKKHAFNFRNLLILVTIGFSFLTFFAKQYDYFKFDLSFTLFIQRMNQVWFDQLMRLISFIGDVNIVLILIALLAVYGFLIGKRQAPLMLIFSTIGGLVLSYMLKTLVSRPRPDPLLIHQIDHFIKADSFPSGHVLGAVSLYGFLLYIAYTQLKRNFFRSLVIGICILVIILMGLSRIYLGAHWFSDVLGAYLIGFVWLSFVVFIYQKLKLG